MEIWGQLNNKFILLCGLPWRVSATAQPFPTASICMWDWELALAGAVLAWLVTGRMTRPLRELTALSRKMAELDFDTRYTSGGKE